MEPMNSQYPEDDFLKKVLELTHQAGALLIFDETITGFRFSRGGAQELFGVTPDLSTFGKGIANGFPLSAVVGRREIMMEMEEIFFSGTFGGELLSLAAAKVVLQRHLEEDICGKLAAIGESLSTETNAAIEFNNLQGVLKITGHSTWRFLNWSQTKKYSVDEIKTYFLQEVFKRGLLVLTSHNVTLSHSPQILKKTSQIYKEVFSELARVLRSGSLREELASAPLKPLFKIR
jgi:glutamate-1-semialdehyde aminotransferase